MKGNIKKWNKNHLKTVALLLDFAISFSLYNCEAALNCLTGLKPPELPPKELKIGYLEQAYFEELIPYVPQNPNAEIYYWDFEIEGQLPKGIDVYLGSGRIVFEGVPKEVGTYNLKISLEVDSVDGVSLCNPARTSKDYALQINP